MAEEVLQREEKIRHIEIDRAKLESEKLQLESEYKTEIAKLEERSKADMERMAREHEDQVRSLNAQSQGLRQLFLTVSWDFRALRATAS